MQKMVCDVCGGKIVIQPSGKEGVCEFCGASYSMERMREMLSGLKVSQTGTAEDVAQWRQLAETYIAKLAFADAEGVVKKILEADPGDEQANRTFEQLQQWKYFDVVDGALLGYRGQAVSLTVPQGITQLDMAIFDNDSALEELILPEGLKVVSRGGKNNDEYTLKPEDPLERPDPPRLPRLRRVVLPSTLEQIWMWTFQGCTALEDITIPPSVNAVGNKAFQYCESLKSIALPAGVAEIYSETFQGCTSLTAIEIPDTVTAIGKDAFDGCTSLTAIEIPDTVTYIGDGAFRGCTSLKSITLPASLEELGHGTLKGCTSLKSVDLPAVLKMVGDGAFAGCEALERIDLPATLKVVGDSAFSGCSALTEVVLPKGLTMVESGAFRWCKSLQSLVIPDGVTYVGGTYAGIIEGCTSLKKLVIPDSVPRVVAKVGNPRFCFGCDALMDVTYPKGWDIELFNGSAFYKVKKEGMCPDCGVRLKGLMTKRCPKCGRTF